MVYAQAIDQSKSNIDKKMGKRTKWHKMELGLDEETLTEMEAIKDKVAWESRHNQ